MLIVGMVNAVTTKDDDKVTLLELYPDFTDKFEMYSGYLDIGNTSKSLHYMFVTSQNDAETDPLLIWFNGGPGCSSMLGFMQEHGPYVIENNSTDFVVNNYSWNTNASVLYIEQPAGVGYSYCDPKIAEDCTFTDMSASNDTIVALVEWFARFPDFMKNELHVSGESYGGIYVPYLVMQINEFNKNNATKDDEINLKSMIVGNGVTNWTYDTMPATVTELYWRSLISQQLHDNITAAKCDYSMVEFGGVISSDCMTYLNKFNGLIDKVNIYNIYGTCWNANITPGVHDHHNVLSAYNSDSNLAVKMVDGELKTHKRFSSSREYTPWTYRKGDSPNELPPCTFGGPLITWANNDKVREQLHIPSKVQPWDLCTSAPTWNYTMQFEGSQWIWEKLKGEYRFLKYSGDQDASVPTLGTLGWIEALNWDVTDAWRTWMQDGQVAGYVEVRDGLTFASVHGAGHMVPQDQRERAHYLINNWLQDKKL